MRSPPPLSARQRQPEPALTLPLLMSGNHPAAFHKPLQGRRHAHEGGTARGEEGRERGEREGNVYMEQLKERNS